MRYPSPWVGPALAALLALGGCASSPQRIPQPPPSGTIELTESAAVRGALQRQLHLWRGTPYRYGGLSRGGVDCSGFVYTTFRQRFGILLPRTTRGQSRIGHEVPRDRLRPGDLVFFRVDGKQRHVGIYLGEEQFMHASTSSGVTRSRLDGPYWGAHYWKAVRVGP